MRDSPAQRSISHSTYGMFCSIIYAKVYIYIYICKYKIKYKSARLYYIIMQKSFRSFVVLEKPNNLGEDNYGGRS